MGKYTLVELQELLVNITNKINRFEELNIDFKDEEEWQLLKAKQEYIEEQLKEVKKVEEILDKECNYVK